MIIDGNNFISHYLKNNIPFAAGKIGGNELQLLYMYLKSFNGQTFHNPWGQQFVREVENVAGLYPMNDETVEWFGRTLLSDISDADLLASWNKVIPQFEKEIFERYCPKTYITKLQHLEPYFFDSPWTDFLEGKTVAVFSPFADSIQNNFKSLDKIWDGKIKQNFELIPIIYPTSIPITENSPYKTSKEIYDDMLSIIHKVSFDVGIFGTGHTGLLFALECKKLGKTGIHLGGPTQILFGIRGNRWDENTDFQSFFNKHWTRPLPTETPKKIDRVEGACYW